MISPGAGPITLMRKNTRKYMRFFLSLDSDTNEMANLCIRIIHGVPLYIHIERGQGVEPYNNFTTVQGEYSVYIVEIWATIICFFW